MVDRTGIQQQRVVDLRKSLHEFSADVPFWKLVDPLKRLEYLVEIQLELVNVGIQQRRIQLQDAPRNAGIARQGRPPRTVSSQIESVLEIGAGSGEP